MDFNHWWSQTCKLSIALLFAIVLILLPTGEATAQGAIVDRTDNETAFGVQLDIGFGTQEGAEGNIFHTDFWGNIAFGDWAFYISVPLNSQAGTQDDATVLGNIDFAGVYSVDLPVVDILLRLGLSVPTGPGVDDHPDDVSTSFAAGYSDPADYVQFYPDNVSIRSAVSAVVDIPFVELRADLGLDGIIGTDDAIEEEMLLRINLGAAVSAGPIEILAELANTTVATADDDFWFHAFYAGIAVDAVVVRPRIGLIVPFNEVFDAGDLLFVSLAVDVIAFQ